MQGNGRVDLPLWRQPIRRRHIHQPANKKGGPDGRPFLEEYRFR
jgi:hypothetical protein